MLSVSYSGEDTIHRAPTVWKFVLAQPRVLLAATIISYEASRTHIPQATA